MKKELIEKIRNRYHREWLLIGIGKAAANSASPRVGLLLAHSPRRDDVYKVMLRRKGPALITYSDNRLPAGYAAAFQGLLPPSLIIVHAAFKGPRGIKVIPMLVDTGASVTIIPPQIALAIGCDPARSKERMAIITASGVEYLPRVIIPEVSCLRTTVKPFQVVCHSLPPQSTVEGLLGLDFLNHLPPFQQFQTSIRLLSQ